MKRVAMSVGLSVAIFMAGCSYQGERKLQDEKPEVHNSLPSHEKTKKVIATDLDVPWDIIKHGDLFYISERPGRILKITSNGKAENMPLDLKKEIVQNGEGGLLGFVLSRDFNTSKTAYIYHTYRQADELFNRIVKLKWMEKRWVEQDILLDNIPGASIHNGGRLKIGPDGHLYVTTGDANVSENAQDPDSLSGKILRMNVDGSIPETNPYPGSYVYSYGHRNPQGLAWGEDGTMYSAEHGSTAHDEINLIQPGKNYGWPVIRGAETKKGMVTPLYHTGQETLAPSGLAYYAGNLYAAGLRGEQILRFNIHNHTPNMIFQGIGRLRDIIVRDGFAYVITNNTDGRGNPEPHDDRLIKIHLENPD